jgi:predicted TIM-barrel fold metal-dependent hydrolase
MVRQREYRVLDADTHHSYPSKKALAPYMPGKDASAIYMPRGNTGNPRGGMRKDALTRDGAVVGSDPKLFVEDHLDRYNIDYAILNPGTPLGLGGLPFLDLAADIASATNDWTIHDWFPVDNRFLGSIVVAPRDPLRAAAEIRRLGSHPRMVQVTVTSAPCLMGETFMHPIYEAANEFSLPINLHVGGGPTGVNPGDLPVGQATSFFEAHIVMCLPGIYHMISMVSHGVFEKYPNIKFVMNEFGVAWLPFVMWRLDMEFRAGREDVPWLKMRPSEYIKQFVRFSTQPLEIPDDPRQLVTLLSLVDAQDVLMFSSDYPHWDFDSPDFALSSMPAEWREKIFWTTAHDVFHLDQRLGVSAEAQLVKA